MSNFLFCRGYCFLDFVTDRLPESFNKIRLDDSYYFYFHNWLDCCVVRQDSDWFLIAGTCLDIKNNDVDLDRIGRSLFNLLLQGKKEDFYNSLDFLGGTFILCFSVSNHVEFYTDCCAIKSAFYTRLFGKTVVASHLNIIPLVYNINFPLSKVEIDKPSEVSYSYGYPGNDSKYDNVFLLTPNTYLNINLLKIERYFPTNNLENGNVEDVANIVKNAFESQMSLLGQKKYKKKYLSLTAGMDSRFTLACVRKFWNELSFFTYGINELHSVDLSRAQEISKILNLKSHVLLDIPKKLDSFENELFKNFNDELDKNTGFIHGRRIAYYYFNHLTDNHLVHPKDIVHIRSNLSEVGRLYYGVFQYYWEMTAKKTDTLAKVRQAYQNKPQSYPTIDYSFSKFIERTSFNDLKNYDTFDMFYWEHRMGTFMSQVVIEGDPTFETINLFNVRFLLKHILSLSISERHSSALLKGVIEDLLPELKDVPIN